MAVQELKHQVSADNFQYCSNFAEKYEMELPCKTVAEFTTFDEKLKKDKTFRDDLVNFLFKCSLKVFINVTYILFYIYYLFRNGISC